MEPRLNTVTYVVRDDQISSDLAGETVILNLKTGIYFGLSEVGVRIWHLLQTPKTVAEIREAILAEYEVDPQRCERDLNALLRELVAQQLVEVRDETAT